MNNGIMFSYDDDLWSSQHAVTSKFSSLMGPLVGHENEIADVVWKVASKEFRNNPQPDFCGIALKIITDLNRVHQAVVRYIHPAYNVSLGEDVNEIRIGPVAIRTGASMTKTLSWLNVHLEVGLGEPIGYGYDGRQRYNLANTMWDISLTTSAAARVEHAEWLAGIAVSLIRLIVPFEEQGILSPRLEHHESLPFTAPTIWSSHVILTSKESGSIGGGRAARGYSLGRPARRKLHSKLAKSKIADVFEPKSKTLAVRFSQGLGWLAKGRQTQDRAQRFLYFFTALEALLTLDDKTSPIVQTIARHVGVLWTDDIPQRLMISKRIKKLYETRSKLVHAGSRTVTFENTLEIHQIVDGVFDFVWEDVDLSMKHEEFCRRLSDASYGTPFQKR